ncbi:MAG: SRPBCC family protein [Bacteroidetes bacterium]|nr:SRPBCC family protein [Bacteroidota bacterium]
MTIETPKSDIPAPAEKVFTYLSDMSNYRNLMPDQVINWQSTADECTFTIKGMATIGMKIVERIPDHEIKIVSGEKSPVKFDLRCHIEAISEKSSTAHLFFESDINPFLKMMVEKPLENFFNYLAEKLKTVF